jgi:hypothetical protein
LKYLFINIKIKNFNNDNNLKNIENNNEINFDNIENNNDYIFEYINRYNNPNNEENNEDFDNGNYKSNYILILLFLIIFFEYLPFFIIFSPDFLKLINTMIILPILIFSFIKINFFIKKKIEKNTIL